MNMRAARQGWGWSLGLSCACGLALLASACSKPDRAPGPGGVTMGEARALDRAAALLDKSGPPPEAMPAPAASDSDAIRRVRR